MHVLYVIPARLASTRLHHKPLRLLGGQPLIRRVVQRAVDLDLDAPVVVATDSRRVLGAVAGLGVDAVLTDPAHGSGTSRVGEVARRPEYSGFEIIVCLQGDEPFMPAAAVRGALERVINGDQIGTAASAPGPGDAHDPNRVKVVVDSAGRAVRFARVLRPPFHRHIGIYACRRDALLTWLEAPPVERERTERLEQLRPLALGLSIGVALLDEAVRAGIDTEDDLALAEAWFRSNAPPSREGAGTGVRV